MYTATLKINKSKPCIKIFSKSRDRIIGGTETGKLLQDRDISQVVDETQILVQAEIRTSNLWLPILGFEAARPTAAKNKTSSVLADVDSIGSIEGQTACTCVRSYMSS